MYVPAHVIEHAACSIATVGLLATIFSFLSLIINILTTIITTFGIKNNSPTEIEIARMIIAVSSSPPKLKYI